MYEMICSILDEMGFVVFENGNDFAISDYIVDSYQFISFIVSIEKKLDTTLPDDFLSYDILQSAIGLSNKLEVYSRFGR